MMISKRFAICSVGLMLCSGILAGSTRLPDDAKRSKPSISLRATPQTGFSPLRVVVLAELKGGADDYEQFYCPSIEWTWTDDDTRSETSADCEPYEAGKSTITRRYTISRVFQTFGDFKVEFRLKQKNKVVGFGSTTVQVRRGVRDGGGN